MNEDQINNSAFLSKLREERDKKHKDKLLKLEAEYRPKLEELKRQYEMLKDKDDMRQVTIVIHFDDKDEAELFHKRVKRMNTIDGNARPAEEIMFYPTIGKIIKLSIDGPND